MKKSAIASSAIASFIGASCVASDEENVSVYHASNYDDGAGLVCVHTDKGRVLLTPEEAVSFATGIIEEAHKAASHGL